MCNLDVNFQCVLFTPRVRRVGGCMCYGSTDLFCFTHPPSSESKQSDAICLRIFTPWDEIVSGERVLIFVDNWPVVDALIKGTSGQATWRDMLMIFEKMDEKQQSLHWICRVPSSSNPADPPSRGTVQPINFLKPFSICNATCPITNQCLQSDVKVQAEAEEG